MKIVLLANKGLHTVALLQSMLSHHIPVEAVIIEEEHLGSQDDVKQVGRTIKRLGALATLMIIYKKLRRRLVRRTRADWHSNDFYYSYSSNIHIVDNLNGRRCEQLLRELDPDIVVLGGTRIIRKNIIDIPKIGILNAHPGLLPRYRGVDVIAWAIYKGGDPGVTVHFVDEGIDTGRIVTQTVIEIKKGDTLASLKREARNVAGELMAHAILKLIESGHIQAVPQRKEDGKTYYRMSERLRQEAEKKLRSRANE